MSSMILLHGFTGAPDSWQQVRGNLPETLHLETPALVGHGGGPHPDQVADFAAEVERLHAVAEHCSSPRHLVGYSLGARLALALLVLDQHLFARATLIGAHPGLESESERTERRQQDERWCRLLEQGDLGSFVAEWQAQPLFATQQRLPPDRLDEQRRLRLQHQPRSLCGSLRRLGLAAMPCYRDALPAITIPVQLVFGDLDTKFAILAAEMAVVNMSMSETRLSFAGFRKRL